MANEPDKADIALLAKVRPETGRVTAIEASAIVFSLIWLIGVALFFWVLPDGEPEATAGLRFMMTLLAIFLPLAMIWVAASAARTARIVRDESLRLQAAVDAMRQTFIAQKQARGTGIDPSVEKTLNEIARATQKTESTLATFATTRPTASAGPTAGPARAQTAGEHQPKLALGTVADDLAPSISKPDLVRALNFPDTEGDEVGFAALRRALKDRTAKQLIRASQDVLTLLSQDGIYMDDLQPDRARAEIWRRFAKGERGKPVASLGGIRDREALASTSTRMREDTIFRDTAHHFLRKYDQMLVTFDADASDADFAALAETRTSRAFMLLGRVTGAFD